jgi:CO/xanthine dehydrogenase Mo-binding subunit
MSPTRREVLAGLGGATLAYVFQAGCSPETPDYANFPNPVSRPKPDGRANNPAADHRDWLIISSDGTVSAFTARTEMGQGLTTVMYNLIGQALELPYDRINVVLGDTELCPEDGPTTGSAATHYVAWNFWRACHDIRADLLLLAAEAMELPSEDLEYREGEIVSTTDPGRRIGMGDLADGQVRRLMLEEGGSYPPPPSYVDKGTLSVHAEAIVTGTLQFTGDLKIDGCRYGGLLIPPYHHHSTELLGKKGMGRAQKTPGIVKLQKKWWTIAAIGETYNSIQKAFEQLEPEWQVPERPVELDNEGEIRAGAVLREVMEQNGDVETGLRASDLVVTESYITQYGSQFPLQTDTAVAHVEPDKATLWVGTQSPFMARFLTSRSIHRPESEIHVIGMPMGGGFGAKAEHIVGPEASLLSEFSGTPVKYVYSRKEEVQHRNRYKESVIVDISTGVSSDGRILARKIDIYQDEGHGTVEVYKVPDVLTLRYKAGMPVKHGTMRGTSYVQTCFGLESHMDMVAEKIGMDPLEFRRRNVELRSFWPLLDTCAEMMRYGVYEPPEDHGIGFGLINHGGRQLGVVGAEVRVDRSSGEIEVVRLSGAFDIGVVINRNTTRMGVRGAMLWGLGFALFEEVELDGHRCYTTGFSNYRIPRFSDTPPIELGFLDNQHPGVPRGCGEMPLPATLAAICNAVYDAIGVRFYTIPMTPERVLASLRES